MQIFLKTYKLFGQFWFIYWTVLEIFQLLAYAFKVIFNFKQEELAGSLIYASYIHNFSN